MGTARVSPLRQRMIEDMNARKLCAGPQRGRIQGCKRFAAFLKRSPDTATAEDIRRFQLHLSETGASICNRNRIMRRLVAADDGGVSFRWKDYRIEGPGRWKTMTLTPHEFIRRFLIHVLPKGFHRIHHYGLLASGRRAANIARARNLLAAPPPSQPPDISTAAAIDQPRVLPRPCPCCGGRMFIIETFARGSEPKHRPTPVPAAIRIDTS